MGEFSISHVLILTLILLIFFGPSRLPALGQSIGKAIRGFKDGLNDANQEINKPPTSTSNSESSEQSSNTPLPSSSEAALKQKAEDKSHQNNS